MNNWQGRCFDAMQNARSEGQIFKLASEAAFLLGFDNCSYGIRSPVPLSRPRVMMFTNYPSEWDRIYRERNYIGVDPIVLHGGKSLEPLVWSEDVFKCNMDLWEEANSFGIKVGWSQSGCALNGAMGLLSVSRDSEYISDKELCRVQPGLMWLAQLVHLKMVDVLLDRILPEIDVMLTMREQEILKWVADGKTSSEVSEILSISERTVNFHVANVIEKLGVTNKTAAVLRAVLLGLIR